MGNHAAHVWDLLRLLMPAACRSRFPDSDTSSGIGGRKNLISTKLTKP